MATKGKVRTRWLQGIYKGSISLSPICYRIPSLLDSQSSSLDVCTSDLVLIFVETSLQLTLMCLPLFSQYNSIYLEQTKEKSLVAFTERMSGAFAVGNSPGQRFPKFLVHGALCVSRKSPQTKKPHLSSGQVHIT